MIVESDGPTIHATLAKGEHVQVSPHDSFNRLVRAPFSKLEVTFHGLPSVPTSHVLKILPGPKDPDGYIGYVELTALKDCDLDITWEFNKPGTFDFGTYPEPAWLKEGGLPK